MDMFCSLGFSRKQRGLPINIADWSIPPYLNNLFSRVRQMLAVILSISKPSFSWTCFLCFCHYECRCSSSMNTELIYEICPEFKQPFSISPEPVVLPWYNLAVRLRVLYCVWMNKNSTMEPSACGKILLHELVCTVGLSPSQWVSKWILHVKWKVLCQNITSSMSVKHSWNLWNVIHILGLQ